MNWFSINNVDGTAYVHLSSDIGCYGVGYNEFASALGNPRKVELCIDSHGGDAGCAVQLYYLLCGFDTKVHISGRCCSSAVIVAMAGRVVRVERGSRILVHSPVSFASGSPQQLRARADQLERLVIESHGIISRRTASKRKETTPGLVSNWFRGDTWFTAEEAIDVGLADEMLPAGLSVVPRIPPASPTRQSPACAVQGLTEQERLFQACLAAFGKLSVRDKEAFGRRLGSWFLTNVVEESAQSHPQSEHQNSDAERHVHAGEESAIVYA